MNRWGSCMWWSIMVLFVRLDEPRPDVVMLEQTADWRPRAADRTKDWGATGGFYFGGLITAHTLTPLSAPGLLPRHHLGHEFQETSVGFGERRQTQSDTSGTEHTTECGSVQMNRCFMNRSAVQGVNNPRTEGVAYLGGLRGSCTCCWSSSCCWKMWN